MSIICEEIDYMIEYKIDFYLQKREEYMEFRNLKKQYQILKEAIDSNIQRVLQRGDYILGQEVSEIEKQLAEFVNVKHCVSCGNGTEALSLVLMAWGVGENDAVFVPDITFFATSSVVSVAKATPIFVDIDPDTFNMSPQSLEDAIKNVLAEGKLVPKVIIPVDLYGQPANYPEILAIAKKYGLKVLADSAQGFGGSINGQMNCSFGDAGITSFFPTKPLACYGDGGAIFTNDDELAELLISIRSQGKGDHRYNSVRIGVNSRLDTIQAAVLLVKLKAFKEVELKASQEVAQKYTEKLADYYKVPTILEGYQSSWSLYTLTLQSNQERDTLQKYLENRGIPTLVCYPIAVSDQKAYASAKHYTQLVNGHDLSKRILSIPMDPYKTDEEIDQVVQALIDFKQGA